MQLWVDKHPALFAVAYGLSLFLTVSRIASWWSGWAVLARRFRLRSKFIGSRWHFQSGQMRWLCGYNHCLTVGGNSEGLYLSTSRLFRPFHPPLFIPWTEISFVRKRAFFQAGVRYELGREAPMPLWVRERLAERVKAAAGQGYPVETLD